MSEERYDVWQWLEQDWHECVGRNLDADAAMAKAASYASRPAATLGIIRKVTIVEPVSDDTVFAWFYGQGVVFPPEARELEPIGAVWRPKT